MKDKMSKLSMSARGRKGAKASPWSKGPALTTPNARRVFSTSKFKTKEKVNVGR